MLNDNPILPRHLSVEIQTVSASITGATKEHMKSTYSLRAPTIW